ncbi:MFS transporter, SP family, solute carrier family 2 (facilitated glucose transporter), member 8 [Geosmithia morbida]|uniref:MFS transporter, SP family, solute carrier family 2 (Facilitated glucose transporter), member 8 n=1 Tax=Geosmithia morbida TaxID=1094350 RepID=A0A9P4YTI0_9HYPO|nr:MFS transporter, SP family, solute carrier family 2 (facilitated glucose transporter), member 8 [Geosmithia morbida]KAF4121494.1 MFS transporter, SP family, solute carrier family 2 (facilitated glucose transporter), member 8 [Geosmithia morbida]
MSSSPSSPTVNNKHGTVVGDSARNPGSEAEKSLRYTELEHSSRLWQALQLYYPAVLWDLFINLATVLKGMDGTIVGSLVGLDPFKRQYGYVYDGQYVIEARWLGAFNYANLAGAVVGAVLAGFAYDRLGPRTPAQLFAGELLNGSVIALYPICASSYIGEVCPLALRGFAASMTNLAFVVGQFIASGILKGTQILDGKEAYKIPIATRWALPATMLILIFFCPDPPFWLAKGGKDDRVERSIRRLASKHVDPSLKLSHVYETLRLESLYMQAEGVPSIFEVFRRANLHRLVICVMAYDMQAFTGNISFINYAVYFFELVGLDSSNAFSMNLGLTSIGFVGSCMSWWILPYVGRRAAYIGGTVTLMILCFVIATLDSAPSSNAAAPWAQCALIITCNFVYDITIGPYCFVLLAEVSSARPRGLTIGLATVTCYLVSIFFAAIILYAMNEDRGNWRGNTGFLYAGLSLLCAVYCYFCMPETKGRTFEELDILF